MTDYQNKEEPVREINVEYVFTAIEKARAKDRYEMLVQTLDKFPKEGQEVKHLHSKLLEWVVAKNKVDKSPSRQQRQLRKLALQFLVNSRIILVNSRISEDGVFASR
ncbi:MAG TPA: hypothetical protein DD400_02910, partial [Rhodospirillaceae bacterium]|nr:hypothetical protein [Rhodospirillaceae bacterium]